jgi:hypothetical protein
VTHSALRREILLSALVSALQIALPETTAASPLNPEQTIIRLPGPAGSFVHRVAGTPHYDGVVRGHSEPAIIAICGVGPVNFALIDPSQPGVRRV